MKHFILTGFLFFSTVAALAQLSVGADGITIAAGETVSVDGITLTPSTDFTFSLTNLTKTDDHTITPVPLGHYIKRYFNFSTTTPAFSGSVRFSYLGAELKGANNVLIPEADLRLNIYDGTDWNYSASDLPDQINDFVEVNVVNATLSTFTLTSLNGALPVSWLSFTAEKNQTSALLKWSTASEINTKDFLVEHSLGNGSWNRLGSVKAGGYSSGKRDYEFSHTSPVSGKNYYRLMQRDLDGKFSYSKVVSLMFNASHQKIIVFPNPVINGQLNIQLNYPTLVTLYDVLGNKRIAQKLEAGRHQLDVSTLSAGTYYVKTSSGTISIIIK